MASYEIIDDVLIKYLGPEKDVVVPEGVIKIAENAFNFRTINSLVLPESLTEIGDWAFSGASIKCPVITIPNNVVRIGHGAFDGKKNIQIIELGDSVEEIAPSAFSSCKDLKKIKIGTSVKQIGERAFYHCEALEEINIPSSVKKIGSYAFQSCTALKKVYIDSSVETVGASIFNECISLEKLTISDVLRTMKADDFIENPDLSITYLGTVDIDTYFKRFDDIFAPNALMKDVAKKEKMKALSAFLNHFYDGHQYQTDVIDSYAKYVSQKRTTLYLYIPEINHLLEFMTEYNLIPASEINDVAKIVKKSKDDSLQSLLNDYKGKSKAKKNTKHSQKTNSKERTVSELKKEFAFTPLSDGTLLLKKYKGLNKKIIIPDRVGEQIVTVIGEDAFCPYQKGLQKKEKEFRETIQSVTIPDTVTTIEAGAFALCKNLSKITLGKNVKTIAANAFSTDKIKTAGPIGSGSDLEFPWETEIPDYAFTGFYQLKKAILPNTITTIGKEAFNSTSIAEVTLPDSVEEIKYKAFYNCSKLMLPSLPKNLKTIGRYAFYACKKITVDSIPDGVKEIPDYAFCACKEMNTLAIPNTVTHISEENAFTFLKTIQAHSGSCAHKYAIEHALRFEEI